MAKLLETALSASVSTDEVWDATWVSRDCIACGGIDGTLRSFLVTGVAQKELTKLQTVRGLTFGVVSLAKSDDDVVYAASADGTISAWNARTNEMSTSIKAYPVDAWSIAVSGGKIAAGCFDGAVNVWENGVLRTLSDVDNASFALSVCFVDDTHVACGSKGGTLRVFDTSDGSLSATAQAHHAPIRKIKCDGKHIFTAGDDSLVKMFDVDLRLVRTFSGHDGAVVSLDVSNGYALSGGVDGTIRLWDVSNTHECVEVVNDAHRSEVFAVEFSPTMEYALSAGADGSVSIYSVNLMT